MPQNPDVRWRQRLQSFRKAFGQLSKAAATARQRELSALEQQGFIQAFEFTHELAWNTLKDFLESRGATLQQFDLTDTPLPGPKVKVELPKFLARHTSKRPPRRRWDRTPDVN